MKAHDTHATARHGMLVTLGIALIAAACSDAPTRSDPPPPPPPPPPPVIQVDSIDVMQGDLQTGVPGSALDRPIMVKVLQKGAPLAGVTVTFTPDLRGSFTPATLVTDAEGMATATWTLGNIGMVQRARIEVAAIQRTREITGLVDSTRAVWIDVPESAAPGTPFAGELLARMDNVPLAPMGPNNIHAPQSPGLLSGVVTWKGAPLQHVATEDGMPFTDLRRAQIVSVPSGDSLAFSVMHGRAASPIGDVRLLRVHLTTAQGASGRHMLELRLDSFISARQFTNVLAHVHVVGDAIEIR